MKRIGVDVGGTGIQMGVVDDAGNILSKESIPTQISLPVEEQVAQIADCAVRTAAAAGLKPQEIDFIGFGIPGIAAPDRDQMYKYELALYTARGTVQKASERPDCDR